ncbi:MAG: hypothetical protein ACTSVK_18165, partial [Promethearchaeota archaeon]
FTLDINNFDYDLDSFESELYTHFWKLYEEIMELLNSFKDILNNGIHKISQFSTEIEDARHLNYLQNINSIWNLRLDIINIFLFSVEATINCLQGYINYNSNDRNGALRHFSSATNLVSEATNKTVNLLRNPAISTLNDRELFNHLTEIRNAGETLFFIISENRRKIDRKIPIQGIPPQLFQQFLQFIKLP